MATKFKTSDLIAKGAVDTYYLAASGSMLGVSVVNKFGENSDIDTTTDPEDIWSGGGINTQPTADRIHAIVSSSTADAGTVLSSGDATGGSFTTLIDSTATFSTDTVAAGDIVLIDSKQDHSIVVSVDSETQLTIKAIHHGVAIKSGDSYRIVTAASTGAAVCHIKLAYTEAGKAVTEFIVLNGTTSVNTTKAFYRLNRMHIHGVGSGGKNAGTITATAATDSTISAEIAIGMGQTLMAIYHVPMGFTGYMTKYYAAMYRSSKISDAMAKIRLKSRLWGSTDDGEVVEHSIGISIYGGEVGHEFNPPKRISQGTDIWMSCEEVTDDNTTISAGFDIILVDNNL